MIRGFILWGRRRAARQRDIRRMVDGDGRTSAIRHAFLWPDEWITDNVRYHRPPWWRPFNAFLHCWRPQHDGEEFHDHPRWSITICLKGCMVERTPWGERTLTPGSIVIRSRKAIHAFFVPHEHRGKTWTLFIVGRRNHWQNRYQIIPQGRNTGYTKGKQ